MILDRHKKFILRYNKLKWMFLYKKPNNVASAFIDAIQARMI